MSCSIFLVARSCMTTQETSEIILKFATLADQNTVICRISPCFFNLNRNQETPTAVTTKVPSATTIARTLIKEPTAEESMVHEPIAEEPIVEEPTTEEPATEELTVQQFIAKESIAQESTEEPTAEESMVHEPIAEEPIVEEPTTEEPTTEELIAKQFTTEESAIQELLAEEPTAEESTTEEPIAEQSTAEEPTKILTKFPSIRRFKQSKTSKKATIDFRMEINENAAIWIKSPKKKYSRNNRRIIGKGYM
ncbi:hypothetical protein ACH3XW_27185 [Acanthocheilonema viteae]